MQTQEIFLVFQVRKILKIQCFQMKQIKLISV